MDREPLRDRIRREVVDAIVTARLEPGERIPLVATAEAIGVSMTPLRECLVQLEREGFVQASPGRGYAVSPLDADEVRQIYPLIWTLEGLALRSAVPSGRVLRELSALNEELRAATSPADAVRLDEAWHRVLLSSCTNQVLLDLLSQLKMRAARYELAYMRDSGNVGTSARQHEEIVDALESGDLDLAVEAIEKNWRIGPEVLLPWLESRTEAEGGRRRGRGARSAGQVALFLLLALAGCTATQTPEARAPFEYTEAEYDAQFYYGPPEPAPERVDDPALGRELDARYFVSFPEYDKAYAPEARARASAMAARLAEEAASLSHEQFVLRLAEIAALADNAHTTVTENVWRKNTPRIPIRTLPFADGLYVLWAGPGFEHLLGARVDSIEGHGVQEIREGLRRFEGGPPHRRDVRTVAILESPALLEAAGFADERMALDLTGVLDDGTPFRERVPAEERGPAAWVSTTVRTLFPREEGDRMASYLSPGDEHAIYLRHPGELLAVEPAPEGGLHFTLATSSNPDDVSLVDYLDTVLERVRETRPAYFVLDLRMNGGGNLTLSQAFARALPDAMGGRPIYVVTSPWTFSAAISTAATVKMSGGDAVKIVGEPVGDRLDFYAEGGAFTLPNSFVTVYYASGRHVYDGPCDDRETCYWLMDRYPIRVDDLAVDLPAPMTFAAYRERRDPAMEAVLRDFANR